MFPQSNLEQATFYKVPQQTLTKYKLKSQLIQHSIYKKDIERIVGIVDSIEL